MFTALAGGCAALHPGAPAADTSVEVHGGKDSVTIVSRWDDADPDPAADRYCQGLGRTAKFRSVNGRRAIFDCVEPDASAS